MRVWLMHPAVFYPFAAIVAATAIAISIRPQSWPHAPAAVAGQQIGGALVLAQSSFDAPAGDPDQNLYITRNFLGQAQTLRIAALPSTPAPGANDRGVQILLSSAAATALANQPATISVNYNPLPINAATGLAVSLQGAGPSVWVTQAAPPQQGMLRFEVPAQAGVSAVGLRAISNNGDQHEAYGLEITRISITPHP